MLNSNIWSNISDGMAIVSDAIRSVTNAMNGSQQMGYPNNGVDINMSRRDLPCYQTTMYNPGVPNQFCMNPNPPTPVYGYPNGYTTPPMMTYIPGMSDPRYGMAPSIYDNRGPMMYQYQNNMMNGYVPLKRYTSPFMNSTTTYGYPNGGNYGY